MRQRDLEILLQRVPGHPHPDPALEQVPTPPGLAAELLFHAHARGDVAGRRVVDLGCGTGVLGIGAALLGAATVTGVDVDGGALEVARDAAGELDADVEFVQMDVSDLVGSWDTALQNPPFGAQRRGADRPFLEAALRVAPVAYSFHLAETRGFVEGYVTELGGVVTHAWRLGFPIPRLFHHHREAERTVEVVVLRIARAGTGASTTGHKA